MFITFEGGEGAGKSTQIARLDERLRREGYLTRVTREPGGSPLAEEIRAILLSGCAKPFGACAEAVLFAAARRDHVDRLIRPALERGCVVVCDRFDDSTHVYQGVVAGLEEGFLLALDEASCGGLRPDLVIVIDVPAEEGLARASRRRGHAKQGTDRFEAEAMGYHRGVRKGFLDRAAAGGGRYVVIDGTPPPDTVSAAIWSAVSARLEGVGHGGR